MFYHTQEHLIIANFKKTPHGVFCLDIILFLDKTMYNKYNKEMIDGDFLKKIEVVIARFLIYISYVVTYLIPVKKRRVSIISYFNHELGLEFSDLAMLLEEEGYELKYDLHKFNSNLWGKFKYLFSFMHQTYLFNTSKLVILDGNSFVFSSIKTKDIVHTMQLWHATGAIKRFGGQSERRYEIKGYDSLIVASEYFKNIFSDYLNTDLAKTHVLGVCKTDYLFKQEFKQSKMIEFYLKYPELKNKKIILYAPTFRGTGIEDINNNNVALDQIQEELGNEYQLVVKYHPLINKSIKTNNYDFSNLDLYQLLFVSDYVISDYSALLYDAALLNKKIVMYLYDINEYKNNRGLCVDLDDFIFEKSYNIKELLNSIKNYKNKDYKKFNEKYLTVTNGNSTKNIFMFINRIMKEGE